MIQSTSSINRYDGNGSSVAFDYAFLVVNVNHLVVRVGGVILAHITDYTVDGVGNSNGGTVFFNDPPAVGVQNVVIERIVPLSQLTAYPEGTKFPSSTVEQGFDYQTMISQQLDERSKRSFRLAKEFNVSEEQFELSANATARADRAIIFSPNGLSIVVGPTAADIAFVATNATAIATAINSDAVAAAQSASDAANSAVNAESGVLVSENGGATIGKYDLVNFIGNNVDITLTDDVANAKVDVELGVAAVANPFTTGDVKLSYKAVADTGWLLMQDQTIGSAASSATDNDDALEDLFTLIWNNVADVWAPVVGGRGASAAADWGDNKELRLPRTLGKSFAGIGASVTQQAGINSNVSIAAETLDVVTNVDTWTTGMSAVFVLSAGTVTGLVSGTTYVIIRSGNSAVQLATTLANAQAGTAINLTAVSADAVWTLTATEPTRVMGEHAGKTSHGQTVNELLLHKHTVTTSIRADGGVSNFPQTSNGGGQTGTATSSVTTTGGNVRMPIMNPVSYINVMIKI